MKKNIFKNMFVIKDISNGEKLALAITVLVILVIAMAFVHSFDKKESKITSENFNLDNAILYSDEINDRRIYIDLTQIILSFLSSYNLELNTYDEYIDYDIINYNREDYYNALTSEYKKSITKNEFLEISKKMCEKFIVKKMHRDCVAVDYKVINKVYLLPEVVYGNDLYICELNTNVVGTKSYIGINLDQKNGSYSIFYLE